MKEPITPKTQYKILTLIFAGWLLVFLTDQFVVPLIFPGAGQHALLRFKPLSMLNYGFLLGMFAPRVNNQPFWRLFLFFSIGLVIITLVESPIVFNLSNS
jgi:hypothetical protein